jgi:hypothetical protein
MRDSPLPSQGLSNFRDASLPSFQRKLEPRLILPLRTAHGNATATWIPA